MAGDSPYRAFDGFRAPLQRAVSCVDREAHVWALIGSNGYSPGQEHTLVPNAGDPVRLRGRVELDLVSRISYRVSATEGERGPWKVETLAYAHGLETPDAQEIIAYHWHPERGSRITYPHLHLGAGIAADLGILEKAHIPTGRVALEDLLRFAILELGVEPQRDDWREVLSETQGKFEERRTWRRSGPNPS